MASGATHYGGGNTPEDIFQTPPPTPDAVLHFHMLSDLDATTNSQHHTLGGGSTQAASGAHVHNGTDSPLLLDTFILTGNKTDGSAMNSIINCLIRLGATDQTT